MDIEKTNITASNSYFQSMMENDQSSVERKTRGEKRKGILRSSYFQHNSSKKDDKEKGNENVLPNYGAATDKFEDIMQESASFQEKPMKRKFDPIDIAQKENLSHKDVRTNGIISSDLDNDSLTERESEQEKFGCNISHLGQYSEIAEKSMEKFVSVISSFKCSSGSRASGLRAPLKDAKNTCTRNRSNEVLDLNKFLYIPPTKRKVLSLSCRRKNI